MKFTFGPESRPLNGYTIKRAIARGGFGEVYYALTDSGKEVAIKLLQENLDVELRGVSQCLNLKHPNLVTIFDIKQDADGDSWVVMEFVSGKTLDHVLHENPNGMALDDVLPWLDGIGAGIGFLHDRGIVHRDLKPANIFRENGIVKVGDVGLSKFIAPSRRSAHTQSVGTVYYMAPEVAKGRYGREVDVYSLAVILYEMLTGKVPFDGETTAEILMKHLTERPNLDPIPAKLRPVFERALEKDPQRRTPDVTELARQFRMVATGAEATGAEATGAEAVASSAKAERSDQTGPTYQTDPTHRSFFPKSKRPKSRWEVFCRACGCGLGTLLSLHPLVKLAALAAMLLLAWPRIPMAGGVRVGSGLQMLWIVIGLIVAYEIFRGVSHAVEWLFLPVREEPHGGNPEVSRGIRLNSPTGSPPSSTKAGLPPWPQVPFRRAAYRVMDPNSMREVSWRRRMTELSGSMATAGLATGLVTAVLAYLTTLFGSTALTGHFVAGTLIGTWALLVLCKLREGHRRERYLDRLLLAGAGALVGVALFQVDQFLLIDLPKDGWTPSGGVLATTSLQLSDAAEQPKVEGYAAFFAIVFGLRRWWWHADAFRAHRFRVMSVLLTTCVGFLAAQACGFPVLWGTVWAASLSSVVQLAAAWTPPEQRG